VSGLRNDSLALFMHHANVVSGSSCLVFEDTKGIVLSAATKRLNKNGILILDQ
jgi:hypothetical protein